MRRIYQSVLFVGVLVLMFLPAWYLPPLQKQLARLQAPVLGGENPPAPRPVWWPRSWERGDYQKAMESHLKNGTALTPFFVRGKSQLDYTLFGDLPHDNILVGKNGYFYTKTGCESSTGRNFIGRAAIRDKARKLRYIVDHYAARGIPWLVWMPPAKSTIIPEQRPRFYQGPPVDSTNRAVFSAVFREEGLPFMDFEGLVAYRAQSPHPLYSPGGLHWSYYTMGLAVDSLRQYFDARLPRALPLVEWRDSIERRAELLGPDRELVVGANQWFPSPLPPMPYPRMRYRVDSSHRAARALVVGDSYYKLMLDYGIHEGLFDDSSHFWYYNHEIHPPLRRAGRQWGLGELDVLAELADRELVLIVVYEANLERFAFNFIENVYMALKKEAK
ncbi:MAG: hypothetical protein AAFW73_08470 [Bacteroidota bacterium]